MTFRVGQKVVLVNDTGWAGFVFHSYPNKGVVYTIRELLRDAEGDLCIRLNEIVNGNGINAKTMEVGEPCWLASRFRPVVERKTSIEIFTAMLNPSQVTVDAG